MKPTTTVAISLITLVVAIGTLWMVWQMQSQLAHTDADASELATSDCVSSGAVQFVGTDKRTYCTVQGPNGSGMTLLFTSTGQIAGGIANTPLQLTSQDVVKMQSKIVLSQPIGATSGEGVMTIVKFPPRTRPAPTPEECEKRGGTYIGGDCFTRGNIHGEYYTEIWGADGSVEYHDEITRPY